MTDEQIGTIVKLWGLARGSQLASDDLCDLVRLAVQFERDACAQVVRDMRLRHKTATPMVTAHNEAFKYAEKAILYRGQTK